MFILFVRLVRFQHNSQNVGLEWRAFNFSANEKAEQRWPRSQCCTTGTSRGKATCVASSTSCLLVSVHTLALQLPAAVVCGCACVFPLCVQFTFFRANLMHATHATPHSPHRDQVPRLLMAAAGIEYQVRIQLVQRVQCEHAQRATLWHRTVAVKHTSLHTSECSAALWPWRFEGLSFVSEIKVLQCFWARSAAYERACARAHAHAHVRMCMCLRLYWTRPRCWTS